MWEGVSRTGRTRERGLGTGGGLANLACVALGSSLPGMGVKRSLQSGGTLLGFLAKILTILSTATNYWIRYPGGHSGLWQECHGGTCSNIPCQSEARPAQMFPTGQTPPPPPPRRPQLAQQLGTSCGAPTLTPSTPVSGPPAPPPQRLPRTPTSGPTSLLRH